MPNIAVRNLVAENGAMPMIRKIHTLHYIVKPEVLNI